jgi:hypothetical protein
VDKELLTLLHGVTYLVSELCEVALVYQSGQKLVWNYKGISAFELLCYPSISCRAEVGEQAPTGRKVTG